MKSTEKWTFETLSAYNSAANSLGSWSWNENNHTLSAASYEVLGDNERNLISLILSGLDCDSQEHTNINL